MSDRAMSRFAKTNPKANPCPKCKRAVKMAHNPAMRLPYRYSVECFECECWSYGSTPEKALAEWQAGRFHA